MPAGRPTKYDDQILVDTQKYIDSCIDYPENRESGMPKTVKLPTLEGLAYAIRVSKDTINEWRKVHPEFSVVIADLLAKQADALVNNGLSGNYNPTIAKVLLTKHGYREGIDATTNDESINNQSEESKARAVAFDEWYKKQL